MEWVSGLVVRRVMEGFEIFEVWEQSKEVQGLVMRTIRPFKVERSQCRREVPEVKMCLWVRELRSKPPILSSWMFVSAAKQTKLRVSKAVRRKRVATLHDLEPFDELQ